MGATNGSPTSGGRPNTVHDSSKLLVLRWEESEFVKWGVGRDDFDSG